jgi:ABC-2 type transport system ATP-binding protein
MTYSIYCEGLRKRYGDTVALDGLDLAVPPGTVCGLLGPNGAGKTTAVRILATLLRPDGGRAEVAGFDVGRQAARVRERIGLTVQHDAVDEILTGRQNLELFGRLFHLSPRDARRRAGELLEQFGLGEAGDRQVKTYSGGMRRRLDLAATLVAAPPVLFLDEPTTGLDPASRSRLWELLRELVADGTTILLTTQYLDEADRLADDIVVLDHGRVVAAGSPADLKARIGGERIDVTFGAPEYLPAGEAALARFADGPASSDPHARIVTVPVAPGTPFLEVVRALDAAGVPATDVHRRQATLDDVFLTLTEAQEVAA